LEERIGYREAFQYWSIADIAIVLKVDKHFENGSSV